MGKRNDPQKPLKEDEHDETTEANEEMKEEFDDEEKDDGLPANRVGGLRGNPS